MRSLASTLSVQSSDHASAVFRAWFANSLAVDKSGAPKLHFALRPFVSRRPVDWDSYGSLISAEISVALRPGLQKTHGIAASYLAVHRPYWVFDNGLPGTIMADCLDRLLFDGRITKIQHEETQNENEFILRHRVIGWLRKFGYDAVAMINSMEDIGSVTWIALARNQVWPVCTV